MAVQITSYTFTTADGSIPYQSIILFLKSRNIPFVLNSKNVFLLKSGSGIRLECHETFVKVETTYVIKMSRWFNNFYDDLLKAVGGFQAHRSSI